MPILAVSESQLYKSRNSAKACGSGFIVVAFYVDVVGDIVVFLLFLLIFLSSLSLSSLSI